MTKPKVIFDPFSEEFFNKPSEVYRRMREEAPLYYNEDEDFYGPFPVEGITTMMGVPDEFRQQVRLWIDTSLHREPGQIEVGEEGMRANIDSAMYYFSLVQERRERPQDDFITRLIAAEIPR